MPVPPPHLPTRRAFTLVELLVVMSIIVLLLSLAVPAVVSRLGGGDLTKSTYEVSGALDRARADAMARRAYRYVAIEPDVVNGNSVLRVRTLGYRTGERFPGNGTASLGPLSPVLTLNNVQLGNFPYDSPPRATAEQNLAALPASYRLPVAGATNPAFLLELAPNGEAKLVESSGASGYTRALTHWIEVGLQPTRGTTATPQTGTSGNRAVVQVAGLTGQTQVYRP